MGMDAKVNGDGCEGEWGWMRRWLGRRKGTGSRKRDLRMQ